VEMCDGLSVKTFGISHGHCIELHTHRGSVDHELSTFQRSGSQPQPSPRSHSNAGLPPDGDRICVSNSSAYFIRDILTGREVLIFGDVEPDSLSLSPRNKVVWTEAARKIASRSLRAIFIECSFDDAITEDRLYGHMAPRFLMEELKALADEVVAVRLGKHTGSLAKKRKRMSNGNPLERSPRRSPRRSVRQANTLSPPSINYGSQGLEDVDFQRDDNSILDFATSTNVFNGLAPTVPKQEDKPLRGVKIVIIHVKEKLTDEPEMGDSILSQLGVYEEKAQLGCIFVVSKPGQAVYL